ncbi:hypothetical protein [Capnocytophaga leadbetteri]|uniref:hypothetical protein n=1 Tax=Capnocytophaga leadbetteri TaxID=327575 RepID=UPI0028EE53AF|nr:hypothetical protein [Capnocytophaga leadbetteri]
MIKYLLKSKIESIRDFILTDTYIFTLDIDSVLYNETLKKSVETTTTNIRRFKNYILTYSNNFYDYNLNRNTYNVPNECFFYDLGYDSYIFLNNSTSMFLYNFEERSIKKQIDFSNYEGGIICLVDNENTLIDNGKNIYLYNLLSEKTIWQYDLETYFHQPAQIMEGRVLVSNNKIIFFAHTEDWSNYATFVLDAQTGQVLFTTQEMGMKLITYNDFVYQIQRKAIKILDPKNLKIETIDVSTYCDEQSIFLDDHTVFFYKDKLYTLAREQGSDVYNIWVIFNLKTQQFEHREDMFISPKKKKDEKNKMFINDIQANDNLVAIRCSDNLYIFEKQDIESK